jgi:hypothetical protein
VSAIAFECRNQVGDVAQVLGALGLWKLEPRFFEWLACCGVFDEQVGVVATSQPAIPDTFGVKRHVRSEITLAEARVADQVCRWLALE